MLLNAIYNTLQQWYEKQEAKYIYIYYKGTLPCLRLYGEAHFRNYVCSLDGFTCTEMPELDGSKHPVFGI